MLAGDDHHAAVASYTHAARVQDIEYATEDTRYPLDLVSSLASLEQEFMHSPNHLTKIAELRKRGYTHRRRVRGDGNCFYRSVGVAWLEALAANAEHRGTVTLTSPLAWPDTAHFGDLVPEYHSLQQMVGAMMRASTEIAVRQISAELFERLLGDVRFDLCVVLLVRRSVADFLESSREDSDIRQTVIAQHGSMEHFVNKEVLPLGQEAEGASLVAAAQQFGVHMTIMQLDGTPTPLVGYTYPSEEYKSPHGIRICLLFKPGHYEVLYHADMPRFQEPFQFTGRCSFCHRQSPLLSSGLLVCFHRMCNSCQVSARSLHATPDANRCLICTGAPPSHRRPCSAPAVRKPAAHTCTMSSVDSTLSSSLYSSAPTVRKSAADTVISIDSPLSSSWHSSTHAVRKPADGAYTVGSIDSPLNSSWCLPWDPPADRSEVDTLRSGDSGGAGASLDENIHLQAGGGIPSTAQFRQPPSWRRSKTPPPCAKATFARARRTHPPADSMTQTIPPSAMLASESGCVSLPARQTQGVSSGRSLSSSATLTRTSQAPNTQAMMCRTCGEFYGNPEFHGLCSQCFRNVRHNQKQVDKPPPPQRPAPAFPRRRNDSRVDCFECSCGFNSGTQRSFDKHLIKFPDSAVHRQLRNASTKNVQTHGGASSKDKRDAFGGELFRHARLDGGYQNVVENMVQRNSVHNTTPSSSSSLDPSISFALQGSSCLGCSCGFTCGTTKALQRHLANFPDSPAHKPGMLEDVPRVPWEDPPVLEENVTIRAPLMRASEPCPIQLF